MAYLAHVIVSTITGRSYHTNTGYPPQVIGALQSVAGLVHEVAEHDHPRNVVAVVDDDRPALDTDLVEPAGSEVVVGREAAQALSDVMQRGVRGECRSRCRHGVLDVHRGATPERRRQQMGPGQLHRAPALLDHDHVAKITVLQYHRQPATAAVIINGIADLTARLCHAEPYDPSRTAAPHRPPQRIVSVENREAVTRHRLHNDGFDVCELLERVNPAQSEMIGLHIEKNDDIVALITEAFAQDAAAGHLEHCEVDTGIL